MWKAILPVEDITTIIHPEIQENYYPMTMGFKHKFGCTEEEMGENCGRRVK